jgi:hypothetical protein
MRYWAFFAAKLVAASVMLYASLGLLNPLVPQDSNSSVTEPGRTASDLANARMEAEKSVGAATSQEKVDHAVEPGTEIQVEIAPLDTKDEKSGDVAKSLDKEEKKRALAPLNYGGQYLAINLALMVWFLFGAGMLYLIVYDQRYRCRVCLRRLRMPVETGSRGFMLQFGRPRIEYICPYGHGTLKQEEFQTSGLENPEWTAHSGDMWDELYAASKQDRDNE